MLYLRGHIVRGSFLNIKIGGIEFEENFVRIYTTGKTGPKPIEHYNSMAVKETLDDPKEILLIDDVITRGATLLGAANKLADAFPNAQIHALAFMRTKSDPAEFVRILDPCKGKILLREDGSTIRNP